MYKNTKRIDTMFVQKNVRRNYQWQKIIMLQKTVQTKIHMDPIRMRMLKMLPARISQIKIQAIKMHPVKIRLTGMQRMHMNQIVMHMTAQSPAITKVISIKKCKAVKNGKAAVWIPLLFCFWCSNLVPKKNCGTSALLDKRQPKNVI